MRETKTTTLNTLLTMGAEELCRYVSENSGATIRVMIPKKINHEVDRNETIRKLYSKGVRQKVLAESFEVSQQTVSRIIAEKK